MTQRKKTRTTVLRIYSHIDEMMASPHQPLSPERRRHQLTRMWQGLRAIETAPQPSHDDWRVCGDAVNLMGTLVSHGEARPDEQGTITANWWRDCAGDWVQIHDSSKLLMDAVTAITAAGIRKLDSGPFRLDAAGIQAVRAVLEDYRDLLDLLPARTLIRAHRLTEKRIADIFSGRCRPHDVEIVDLRATA
ncbi:hypothetical protein [Malikia sp.]|uniref:hypothetical protein n=1 Tax=Malikia sp. TaxID=2070706 RepID=UPI002635E54D|nr:hypothetical protein [Malikia sp.]MDD2730381.1 hypothetical protein [Malikia sp.]